jgi:MFS family permease
MASSYLLATAASIPLWGKLSDIWGRKPILLLVNILFLAGSLICALSVDLAMLLAGRATQGVGGGGVLVLSQICVSDLFSERWVATIVPFCSPFSFSCLISSQHPFAECGSEILQGPSYILWNVRSSMGHCERSWPNYRWSFNPESLVAVVLLSQL